MAKKSRIWNFFDGLKGDKVVWMIVMMLIMISSVCIFSSTSMETAVVKGTKTRVDMVVDLLKTVAMGLVVILGCYNCINAKWYRRLGMCGFAGSLALLTILVTHADLGVFKASSINSAWRVITIGGLQVHVYEVVKVAMVMYMAWAVDQFHHGGFTIANWLSNKNHFHWLKNNFAQKCIYIYGPLCLVVMMVFPGSGSSALFIGAVMLVTILVGGLSIKDLTVPVIGIAALCVAIVMTDKATDGAILEGTRFSTWESRLKGSENWEQKFKEAQPHTKEWQDALDKIRQPYSAKIAIKEGGLIGKGPGQSTQRYVVPVMYEDYMYSFILEEYGVFGGLVVLILFVSLLARGSVIVRNTADSFSKILVAGLVILITGQAMLHMMVNSGLMVLTGQTLPLISYGTSSFLMFCIAFGIILSISRDAGRKIAKETRQTRESNPLSLQREGVQGDLDALDDFETAGSMEDDIDIEN